MSQTVGYATLQIIPSAKGFGSALNGQVASPMAAGGKEGGKRFGGGMLKGLAGPLAAVGAAFAATKVVGFLGDAIGLASDLNETGTKTEAIFGKAGSAALQKFAADSARSLGQTKQAALDASATFGVFGKSAGLRGNDLVGFSTKLTTLATDMASFSNTSPEEAAMALSAALRGESEPIRKYGVLLDSQTIKQEAVRQGLIKTTKDALTPANRVLAVQALIMKQTTDAQGDFAKTSGGLANQQRILSAQFVNLKTKIGSAFLPVAVKVVTLLNDRLLPAFSTVWAAVKPLIDRFVGLTAGTDGLRSKIAPLAAAAKALWAALQPIVLQVIDLGRTIIATLIPAVMSVYSAFADALVPVIQALAETFQRNIAPALSHLIAVLKLALPFVIKLAAFLLKVALAILKVVLPVLLKLVGFLLGTVINVLANVVQWIGNVIDFFRRIGPAIGHALAAFGRFVASIATKGAAIFVWFATLPSKVVAALGNLIGTLLSAGGDLIGGFIQGIRNKASDLINAIKETITDKLPGFVKKALGIHSPSRVFAALGHYTIQGFIRGMADEQRNVKGVLDKMIDVLGKRIDAAKSRLADLQSASKSYASSASASVIDLGNVSGATDFATMVTRLQEGIVKGKAFASTLARLKKAGLNRASFDQLVQAGPEQGLAAAQALLAQGGGGIAQVNALEKQLAAAGVSVGSVASKAMYQAGIDSARGLVKGLKSQKSVVVAAMESLSGALVRAVKKALGIHSPSTVFADLGKFTALGFAVGVDDHAAAAQKAMTKAISPPSAPSIASGGVTGAAANANGTPVSVPLYLDGAQIAEAVFTIGGREYAYGRKG